MLLQFQVLMSMQMDAYLKKEQIGTLFVWVGAPEGGFGGWAVGQGVSPKIGRACPKYFFINKDACILI